MDRRTWRRHTAAAPNKFLHQTGKDPAGENGERATMGKPKRLDLIFEKYTLDPEMSQ